MYNVCSQHKHSLCYPIGSPVERKHKIRIPYFEYTVIEQLDTKKE